MESQDSNTKKVVRYQTQNSINSQKAASVSSSSTFKKNATLSTPHKSGRKDKIKSQYVNEQNPLVKQIREQEVELNQLRVQQRTEDNQENISQQLQEEILQLRNQLQESEKARENLQMQIMNSQTQVKENLIKQDKYKDILIKENEELRHTLAKKDKEIRDKTSKIDYYRQTINIYEIEKQEMALIVEETLAKYKNSEGSILESEQKRVLLQKEYEQCLDEYNSKLKHHYEQIEILTQENEDLKQKIRDLEKELGQSKIEKLRFENFKNEQQDLAQKLNEQSKILKDVKSERDLLLRQLEIQNKEKEALLDKFKHLREDTHSLLEKMKQELDQQNQARKELEQELFEKDEDLAKKYFTIKNLTQKQLDMQDNIQEAQRLLEAHNDLKQQLDDARNQIENFKESRLKLQSDLSESNKLLKSQGENSKSYSDQIKELQQRIKEQDQEIEAMKLYVQQMRSRYQVYIPDKEDPIDTQLAEYINNFPKRSKLRIMFMRESDGIYQFGSRKVYVRVERDKISVRVGGGYLSIDEFLDIYTPMELERLDRNDPIKKFSEKVAVQKTLEFNSAERSPNRIISSRQFESEQRIKNKRDRSTSEQYL